MLIIEAGSSGYGQKKSNPLLSELPYKGIIITKVGLVSVVIPEVAVGGCDVMREDRPVLAAIELLRIAIEGVRTLSKIPTFLFGTEDGFLLNPSVVFVEINGLNRFARAQAVDTVYHPSIIDGGVMAVFVPVLA